MAVIDNINFCLAERGMSGADLARALGYSSGVYSQWNTGLTNPRRSTVKKIADYFGVTVDYLLRDNKKAAPEGGVSAADKAILDFLHTLPPRRLRALLEGLDAPEALLDALDREARQE